VTEALGWYLSIFGGLFLTGIGLPPVPEEVMIVSAAGLTAARQEMHWWLSWPAVVAGIICADSALYGIGRLWGPHQFDHRWVQRLNRTERRQQIEQRFHTHGIKILLTARLLPPLRTGVFLIAGAIRYSYPRFVLADSVYAIFGVGLFFFGSQWLIGLLMRATHWIIPVAAGVAGAYLLHRYYLHLRRREMGSGPRPPVSVAELPPAPAVAAEPAREPSLPS
jgi:membrane protein DedA with SNARE-associated domain